MSDFRTMEKKDLTVSLPGHLVQAAKIAAAGEEYNSVSEVVAVALSTMLGISIYPEQSAAAAKRTASRPRSKAVAAS